MHTSMYLQQKSSGNYIITPFIRENWTFIKECSNPTQLYLATKQLNSFSKIIKSEYSKSQLTTTAAAYSIKDALKAFGMKADMKNVLEYSI
jgi:hypothetical protein